MRYFCAIFLVLGFSFSTDSSLFAEANNQCFEDCDKCSSVAGEDDDSEYFDYDDGSYGGCCNFGYNIDCSQEQLYLTPYGYGDPCDCGATCDPCWYKHGILMPQCKTLFPQFMADPRAINMSVGWRFNDSVFDKNVIDVSYGQPFPIWRWFNVFCCGDAMEIDLEGALWAIFEPLDDSAPLVNADYYVGFPLTWACGRWSWRLRGYHISSHIGDEYLIEHPGFDRRNPSAQYLDFFLAYQLTEAMRIYWGYGRIFMVDASFPVKRNYFEWGVETYFPYFNWDGYQYCVLGRPFYAMHFRFREDDNYREDATYVLGYELYKMTGLGGKLRGFLEYHKGASLEGQFCRFQTDYLSFRLSYGY
ncbi:MAG: DUF1207 domain-containing protein [Chlamydiales bacterium]|nr:DUF1207 domain-containing protein [Chlamydiales bacterium]